MAALKGGVTYPNDVGDFDDTTPQPDHADSGAALGGLIYNTPWNAVWRIVGLVQGQLLSETTAVSSGGEAAFVGEV